MSSFTKFDTNPSVLYSKYASEKLKKDLWVVEDGFTYELGEIGSGEKVIVPHGYLTDGASVPRLLWSLLPPWGPYGQAVILHDFLCDYAYYINKDGDKVFIDRKKVDEIFFESLDALAIKKWVKFSIKNGVSLFRIVCRPKCPGMDIKKHEIENELRNWYSIHDNFEIK